MSTSRRVTHAMWRGGDWTDPAAIARSRRLLARLSPPLLAVLTLVSIGLHCTGPGVASGRSYATFAHEVAPVLAASCSAVDGSGQPVCHGRPSQGSMAEAGGSAWSSSAAPRTHVLPASVGASCAGSCHGEGNEQHFSFALDADGRIGSDRQMLLAFEMARRHAGFGGAGSFARLLRMPLGAGGGGFGLAHGGGEVFESAQDPAFRDLASWVEMEHAAARDTFQPPGPTEVFFRDHVLPVFARNSCMAPSCHAFNHSSFIPDPGLPTQDLSLPIEQRFSPEQVAFDRATSKGMIQTLVHLWGDLEQSRILRKIVPVSAGGVLHRGGNDQFLSGRDDPDYQAILQWLRLERRDVLAKLKAAGRPVDPEDVGKVRGVVFVRTRRDNPRRFLDVGRYQPGGDLFLLKLGDEGALESSAAELVNLTARFHPGRDADVREPDVRYDGRAIVFAMRIGERDRLNVYEIRLDERLDYEEGSLRRLTWGPEASKGIPVHFTDPTYVPDPLDENAASGGYNLDRTDVVFSGNLSGELARSSPRGILGEADGGDRSTILDMERTERDGSFVGRRLHVVDGTGAGQWRTIVGFENRLASPHGTTAIRLDRPLPQAVDDTTIYSIERDPRDQPGFLPSYSVYGIKGSPVGGEQEAYERTLSRITWGGGQEVDLSVRSTGEVFYSGLRSGCDKYGRSIFHMASCRRHLDTRFSFPTHHGNRSEVLILADNHELPTGIDIHAGLDPDSLWEGGDLSVSDHQFGPGIEAHNPHDFVTGIFDEMGIPRTLRPDITNTRFEFERGAPSHPRFVFKNGALFPSVGPGAVTRTGLSPGGIFRDPYPLPDGRLLVSYAGGPIDHLDASADPDFDLFVLAPDPSFQPPSGKGVPKVALARLAVPGAAGWADVMAVPVVVRPKEKINAGRRPVGEHLIRAGSGDDPRPAKYLERNYLLIDAIMRDPSPVGKRAALDHDPVSGEPTAALDRVVAVRMLEVVPATPQEARPLDLSAIRNGDPESTIVGNGIHPQKRVVGEIPLQSDGSVVAQVPARTPMVIQSLNADGMALRQEARYYSFAPAETFTISPSPGETFQTCGACMGSMTGKPADLFGPSNPFSGQGEVQAIARGKEEGVPAMGLLEAQRTTVDFARDVQPILDAHCAACHQGSQAAAGLSLTSASTGYYSDAYESLMQLQEPASGWYGRKRYVSERDGLAIESYLVEKLEGRELKAPQVLAGDAPHPSAELFRAWGLPPAPLSPEERRLFALWIDLGATFLGPETGLPASGAPAARQSETAGN